MPRLEEKLVELGYSIYKVNSTIYAEKNFRLQDDKFDLNICVLENKIIDYSVSTHLINCYKQSQIDNLQQAFNTLQQDLEVLK